MFVNSDIPFKYLRNFHLPGDIPSYSFEDKYKAAQATCCFYIFFYMFLNKDADISETFNNYFPNITKDLEIFD